MQSRLKHKRQTVENRIEVVLPKQMIIQPTKKGQKQVCSVLNTGNEIVQGEMFPIVCHYLVKCLSGKNIKLRSNV